jgi:hypothetical protein
MGHPDVKLSVLVSWSRKHSVKDWRKEEKRFCMLEAVQLSLGVKHFFKTPLLPARPTSQNPQQKVRGSSQLPPLTPRGGQRHDSREAISSIETDTEYLRREA